MFEIYEQTLLCSTVVLPGLEYIEDNTKTHYTIVGTYGGVSVFEGFLYMVQFSEYSSYSSADFVDFICSGNCFSCPKVTGECISNVIDPYRNQNNEDCNVFGCTGGCNIAEVCFTCPNEE